MTRARRVLGGAILVLGASCATEIDRRTAVMERARGVPYDVEHYAITIEVDPLRREIDARCTIRLWAAPGGDALQEVDLQFDGLDVLGVQDAAGNTLAWYRASDRLTVRLAAPLARGEYAELTVHYTGPPRAGLYFAGERGGVATQVYTHGQCSESRAWFPCRDHPSDRATTDVTVTMPIAWTSIAAGERVGRVERGEKATEHWRMDFPHPAYLVTLAAGDFTLEHDTFEDVPLTFACAPEHAAFLRETFAETDEILGFFSDVTGVRYPYAKYAQTCVDNYPLGGMENVSATTLTELLLPDEPGRIESAPRELVAHEAAHQWFGNLVTCADWNDAWLNEGFATYFAALYEEHAEGRDAFEATMRAIRAVYMARDVGLNRRPIAPPSVTDPLAGFFTGHVYQGGATRLHYLRGLLGDIAFFAGVRRYLASHRGGSVTTDDLRVAFEQASGRDLRAFFKQWIRGVGHPSVKSWWKWDAARQRVELTLVQSAGPAQSSATSFDLELEVEIVTASGPAVHRVRFDRPHESFELAAEGEPLWVRVDPRDWAPMELDERMSAQCWLALATRGDTSGRLRALGVLARGRDGDLKPAEVDVVEDAFLAFAAEDEDPNVRRTALAALGRSVAPARKGAARVLFLYAARHDVDHEVRRAAFVALRSFGRDAEVHELAASVLARCEGWGLRADVVLLLAESDPDQAFETLEQALQTRSVHGEFEARILARLHATEDPRAPGILLAWLRDETAPDVARTTVLRELARSGLRHGALEPVIEALASRRIVVRRAALAALSTSDDARARSAIEQHAALRPSAIERISADAALDALPGEP